MSRSRVAGTPSRGDSPEVPELVAVTARYEAWVDGRVPTVPAARADKHMLMAADPFAFLRASYYRWAQR
jgi:hypothetical protein